MSGSYFAIFQNGTESKKFVRYLYTHAVLIRVPITYIIYYYSIIYYCYNHASVTGTYLYYIVAIYCRACMYIMIICCCNLMSAVTRKNTSVYTNVYKSTVLLPRLFIIIYCLGDWGVIIIIIIILANILVRRSCGSACHFFVFTKPTPPAVSSLATYTQPTNRFTYSHYRYSAAGSCSSLDNRSHNNNNCHARRIKR